MQLATATGLAGFEAWVAHGGGRPLDLAIDARCGIAAIIYLLPVARDVATCFAAGFGFAAIGVIGVVPALPVGGAARGCEPVIGPCTVIFVAFGLAVEAGLRTASAHASVGAGAFTVSRCGRSVACACRGRVHGQVAIVAGHCLGGRALGLFNGCRAAGLGIGGRRKCKRSQWQNDQMFHVHSPSV